MVRRFALVGLATLLTIGLVPACGFPGSFPFSGHEGGDELFRDAPKCGNPGFDCPNVPNTDSKVVYFCNLHVENAIAAAVAGGKDISGEIPVCLPTRLNRFVGDPAAVDALSQDEFNQALLDFGNGPLLDHLVSLKGVDSGGDQCGVAAQIRADEGTNRRVVRSLRDPFCEVAANLSPVVCQETDCHFTASTTINPRACACNTTPDGMCNFPTQTVNVPPPGSGDPPGDHSGVFARANSAANTVETDPNASRATVTISFEDDLDFDHSDTKVSTLSGTARLFGRRKADGTADLLFEMSLAGTDITLNFDNVDVIADVDVHVSKILMGASLGDAYLHVASNGFGTIPAGALGADVPG